MSPEGKEDPKAEISSLHNYLLYRINQGVLPEGEAVDEKLSKLGLSPEDLDLVLLSNLDCDHVNGLSQVKEAQKIMVSEAELQGDLEPSLVNKVRFQPAWWEDVPIETFTWNGSEGPAGHSYDVFGDGSVQMIEIPGHSKGQCALKLTNKDGKFVLLYADGGYAEKSWKDMIQSGIAENRKDQKHSLEWIREQSLDPDCVASLANHDPAVEEQVIEL